MRAYIFATLIPLAACGNFGGDGDDKPGVAGAGSGNARTFAVADFGKVEARGPDDVDVRVGPAFSVRAEGDEEELGKLKIERRGDTLRVGRVTQNGISWNQGKGVKVHVTMPKIAAGSIAGSGDLSIDRVDGGDFEGAIAGSGDLAIAAITARALELSIAGSGGIKAAGSADSARLSIAGSGDIDADKLTTKSADISIAGAGNIGATVNGPAKISIVGSGDVALKGKPQCQTSKMGSGSVRCGD